MNAHSLCSAPRLRPLTSDLRPVVYGHRGNAAHAPENTLESFREAIALGVDGLEFDVRLSADGELVVIHDPTVDRTTNGTGAVSRLTLEQLQALDAGARFGPMTYPYSDRGITIPTVAEALDATAPLPLIVEVKAIEAAQPLVDLLRARGDEERVTIGSFIASALLPFRRVGIATSASLEEVRALLVPAVCRFRRNKLPYDILSVPPYYRGVPIPVGALARCVAPAGTTVYVWTVNDPRTALGFWRRGVRGILSDDPAAILEARRSLA
ncbi:MAG: glycerophosphodiester phosphodiesterase family protein [Gemmatimonadaceae bacterium]